MFIEELARRLAREKIGVSHDSRKTRPGDVFVAVSGASLNGANYIRDALNAGAKTIVCAREAEFEAPTDVTVIRVDDPREALWRLAAARWDSGAKTPVVIGVTGTNGKTTVSYLLEKLFASVGSPTGVLGTVEYRWPNHREAAPLTTPGPLEAHEALWRMAEAGVKYAIMEVSSHALAQKRVDGVNFAGAIFTNLTQDHLDFHKDMESYFLAKARLFLELGAKDKTVAINVDDPWGARLLALKPEAVSYGLEGDYPGSRHLRGRVLGRGASGMELEMEYAGEKWRLSSPMVGDYNAANLLAAQALALGLGFAPETFVAWNDFAGAPGRLERVPNARGLNVFVDYAHTPDAIAKALKALRQAGYARTIIVFGCGGDRDRTKRPLMAEAAAGADVAILTSDNPRFEDPERIIADAKPGLRNAAKAHVEPDRRAATALAINLATPGDAVLIAGKGHENYQLIKGVKHHYSDVEIAREILNCVSR